MRYFLFLLLIIFSCKKKEISPLEESISESLELFNSDFTQFERSYTSYYRLFFACGEGEYFRNIHCKLGQGFYLNNQYYYSIFTKWEEYSRNSLSSSTFYKTGDWEIQNKQYRYDPITKIAYLITNNDVNHPKILFDFNCNVGNTILLDSVFQIQLKVTSIQNETLSGSNAFPVIRGKIVRFFYNSTQTPNGTVHPFSEGEVIVSPFLPHPTWFSKTLGEEGISFSISTVSETNFLKRFYIKSKSLNGTDQYNTSFIVKGLLGPTFGEY